MRLHLMRVLIVGLLMAVGLPLLLVVRADEVPKGLEKFQGNWKLVGLAVEGKEIVPPPSNGKLVVKREKFTYTTGGGRDVNGTYAADTTPNPPTLDIAFTDGEGKGTTRLAVYEVKGATLKICMASSSLKPRPELLAAKAGTIVETWMKVK
jgi:uncharacterized protein (TIGR03067 family)